jgi:hypothetical protein
MTAAEQRQILAAFAAQSPKQQQRLMKAFKKLSPEDRQIVVQNLRRRIAASKSAVGTR